MRRLRAWFLVCALIGLSLVVWGVIEVNSIVRTTGEGEREVGQYARPFEPYVESLRKAGVVVDIDEVDGPMPAESENAAGEIDAAWRSLVAERGPREAWPAQPLWSAEGRTAVEAAMRGDPRLASEIRQFLEAMRPWFDRVTAALDRPHLRWPRTIEPEIDPFLAPPWGDWVLTVQGVVRMLEMRARVADGAADRLAAIRDIARLGSRLDGGEEMYRMLASASTIAALSETRSNVEQGTIDARVARQVAEQELSSPWFPRMTSLLVYRRAQVVDWFHALRDGRLKPDPGTKFFPSPSALDDPASAVAFVAACEVLGQAIEWVPKGYPEWHRRFADAGERAAIARHPFLLIPEFVAQIYVRDDAAIRLARVALAVAEFRAAHGEFLASLDDLKPAFAEGVPLDPYTELPFVYEKTASGVRIASAGRFAEAEPVDEEALRERCLTWDLRR